MTCKNKANKILSILVILLLFFINRPMQAHASGVLVVGDRGHYRHGEYTEVIVNGNRYYYNDGVYYVGSPGSYVVVEAPVGAVVYDEPVSYEVVEIDGARYYRHNNVYYRSHFGGGYEVVRIKERHGDEHDHDHDHN